MELSLGRLFGITLGEIISSTAFLDSFEISDKYNKQEPSVPALHAATCLKSDGLLGLKFSLISASCT